MTEELCGHIHCRANRPDTNPDHVCVRPKNHPGKHRDLRGYEWSMAEPRHIFTTGD